MVIKAENPNYQPHRNYFTQKNGIYSNKKIKILHNQKKKSLKAQDTMALWPHIFLEQLTDNEEALAIYNIKWSQKKKNNIRWKICDAL